MKHIIDTEQIEKLPRYEQDKFLVRYEDVVKLIANSPQADGMLLEISDEKLHELITEHHPKAQKGVKRFEVTDWWRFGLAVQEAMLSAYKPQADDVRKDALVEKAKKMYIYMTDNHPTIHTNRFPTWDEISEEEKNEWISKATKL